MPKVQAMPADYEWLASMVVRILGYRQAFAGSYSRQAHDTMAAWRNRRY